MISPGEAAQGEVWLSRARGHGRRARHSGCLYGDDDDDDVDHDGDTD